MRARVAGLITAVCLSVLFCSSALARGRLQGYVEQGGMRLYNVGVFAITRPGSVLTSPYSQQSYPSATVTVYDQGTSNLSTIYADNAGTSKANPFTASNTGYWFFYANDGRYDVQFSGTGLAVPYTLSDLQLVSAQQVLTVASCVNDGVTDATTCLQAALDAAKNATAKGGELYIPAGKYAFSALDVAGFGCNFGKTLLVRGAGMQATQLYHTGSNVAIDLSGANFTVWQDIGLQANTGATTKVGFLLTRLTDSREAVGGCATWPLNSPFSANNSFLRVRTDGPFIQAAFACMACEETTITDSVFYTTGAAANLPAIYVSDSNPAIFTGPVAITIPKVGGTITQSAVYSTITNHFIHSTFASANTNSTVFLFNRAQASGAVEAQITDSDITYNGPGGFNASGIVYQTTGASGATAFGLKIKGTLFELAGGDAIIPKASSGTATFNNFAEIRDNTFTQSPNVINVSGAVVIQNLIYEGNTEFTASGFAATPTLNFNGSAGSQVAKSYIRATGPGTIVNFGVNTVAPGTIVYGRTITTAGSLHGAKLITLGDYAVPYQFEERYKGWPAAAPARTYHQVWETYQGLFDSTLMDDATDTGRILTGDGSTLIPGSTNTGVGSALPSIFSYVSSGCCWHWMTIVPTTSVPSSSADGTAKFTNVSPGSCLVNATEIYCKMTDGTWRKKALDAF